MAWIRRLIWGGALERARRHLTLCQNAAYERPGYDERVDEAKAEVQRLERLVGDSDKAGGGQ